MKLLQLLLEYNRDKTIATYGKKIEMANLKDNQRQSVATILSKIEDVDPSINKQYVQWICKQYISGALKLEDLYKVTEPLIVFQQYKQRLPQEKRDINKLTVFDLYNVEEQIKAPHINSDTISNNFDEAVKVWYDGPLGYLITPLTKEAAQKYSKGTKWCTGAMEHNRFDYYNRRGPLFIWRDKNGEKFQFHGIGTDDESMMDARDEYISSKLFEKFKIHPVLKELLTNTGYIFKIQHQAIQQIDWKSVHLEEIKESLSDGEFNKAFNHTFNHKIGFSNFIEYIFKQEQISINDTIKPSIIHEIIDMCPEACGVLYSELINISTHIDNENERKSLLQPFINRVNNELTNEHIYLKQLLLALFDM